MNPISFQHDETCGIDATQRASREPALQAAIAALSGAREKEKAAPYSTPYAHLAAPFDEALRERVIERAQQVQKSNPHILLLIGIGGSSLGTVAAHESVHGSQCHRYPNGVQLLCADTVDSDATAHTLAHINQALEQGKSVHLNVVSKSGKTTETVALFSLFLNSLKTHRPDDYREMVTITTDENSPLWEFGKKEGFACLAIPKNIGGRYSVFSAVGLFPLALYGMEIDALHKGAQDAIAAAQEPSIEDNPAAARAAILHTWYQKDMHIHDLFLFDRALHSIGLWYRQLVGESLGKQHDLDGNEVRVGITPTVSVGSTDLHSVGQLYLGGPRERFTTFLAVANPHTSCTIPSIAGLEQLVPHVAKKSLLQIMQAILGGTQRAYQNAQLPFATITLLGKDPYVIGFLLQTLMIETIYLAHLLRVNPFDQPQVELYKKETRALLAHEE